MNSYNRTKTPGGFSPGILVFLGVVLTAAIILGIKFLIGGDAGSPAPQPSGQADIFKEEKNGGAPGLNPAARSETASGDSLDIFAKTNAGYAADESSPTAAAEPARPAAQKRTAAPDKKQAAKNIKKARPGTVIPRLQGGRAFGAAAPADGGAGTPDIAEMMRQAKQKQGN